MGECSWSHEWKLFRCVCRAGTAWGDGMTEKEVWHVVKEYAAKLGLSKVARHTTFAGPVHACVMQPKANWSRSNSCSATSRCRRRKSISDARERETTRSASTAHFNGSGMLWQGPMDGMPTTQPVA